MMHGKRTTAALLLAFFAAGAAPASKPSTRPAVPTTEPIAKPKPLTYKELQAENIRLKIESDRVNMRFGGEVPVESKLTYARLKAENDKLQADIASVKARHAKEDAASEKGILVGMTLQEARAIAMGEPRLRADDGEVKTYDIDVGPVTLGVYTLYTVDVKDGKVVRLSMRGAGRQTPAGGIR